jgi:hypothetical protein
MWGGDDTHVFAVSDKGIVVKGDGTNYSDQKAGITANLRGIWGSGASDIWVVGDTATAYHYDGNSWQSVSNSNLTGFNLTGVWGDGQGGIWVSANKAADGYILKY